MLSYKLARVTKVFDRPACYTILFCFKIYYQNKMTQYNTLNVKLSNSQLNKLKSGIKNGTEVTFNFHQILLVILMIRPIFCISCY